MGAKMEKIKEVKNFTNDVRYIMKGYKEDFDRNTRDSYIFGKGMLIAGLVGLLMGVTVHNRQDISSYLSQCKVKYEQVVNEERPNMGVRYLPEENRTGITYIDTTEGR